MNSSNESDSVVPESLSRRGLVLDVVEGVEFAQRSKPAFQIVDDGPRRECLGAIRADAWAKMNIVVDSGLFMI